MLPRLWKKNNSLKHVCRISLSPPKAFFRKQPSPSSSSPEASGSRGLFSLGPCAPCCFHSGFPGSVFSTGPVGVSPNCGFSQTLWHLGSFISLPNNNKCPYPELLSPLCSIVLLPLEDITSYKTHATHYDCSTRLHIGWVTKLLVHFI